jgi:hypothetical protein
LDRTVVGHYGNMRILESRVPSYTLLARQLDAFSGRFVARDAVDGEMLSKGASEVLV